MKTLEQVFVTEGVPDVTFVEPPNYNQILVDVRHPTKPVILEGQSGTGKTTTVKKILERLGSGLGATYLTARKPEDLKAIESILNHPKAGVYLIDDFHRLDTAWQSTLANMAKVAAEEPESGKLPKLVLIGINHVGAGLIHFAPDIAKRCGVHRITPGTDGQIASLVAVGCKELNITMKGSDAVFAESRGDYWLTQQLCQTACALAGVLQTSAKAGTEVVFDTTSVRQTIVGKLANAYNPAVKEFCRGRRFRPSNDPYYKLLKAVSLTGNSNVDLVELANSSPDVAGSINNIKDDRLGALLAAKPIAARYFYYNGGTAQFAIEDPAVFYYIQHLDWERLRLDCGFRSLARDFEFDVAISFAGENRELARFIAAELEALDVRVFFDEYYETNYLGKTWNAQFKRIFATDSRFVVCVLDKYHLAKIWPTFERDCFTPRVASGEVIPVFLDDSVFVGIPKDLIGFKYKWDPANSAWKKEVSELIVSRVTERIG